MLRYTSILFLILSTFAVVGQDTLILTKALDSSIEVDEYISTFVDPSRSVTFDKVQDKEFVKGISLDKFKNKTSWDNYYWQKFNIQNISDDEINLVILSHRFYSIKAYVYEEEILIDEYNMGMSVSKKEREIEYSIDAFNLTIPPNRKYRILLHNKRPHSINTDLRVWLLSPDYYKEKRLNYLYKYKGIYFFRSSFIAILGFLFCFTVFQFYQHKDVSYLYYSGYLIAMFFYFLNRHENNAFYNVFYSYNPNLINQYAGGEPSLISPLAFIFYLLFTDSFLNLRKHALKLRSYVLILIKVILVGFIFQLILYIFDIKPSFAFQFNEVFRGVLNIPLIGLLILLAFKVRTRLSTYFLIGSFALVLGTITSFYIKNSIQFETPILRDNIFWTQLGTLIECLFFSAGLGYKTKLISDERTNAQELLINKLNENKVLQDKLNDQLRKEVDIKTEENVKHEYENKILQLESELLSAQMNPHFIFNSLNSIKYYALTKTPVETAKFVTTFAKLMRIILNNSKKKLISLKEEIEFLSKYLEVEQKRFEKKFKYEIYIDNIVDQEETLIPPMLLQPYIENALWHGLLHKDRPGKLQISITKNQGFLVCIIEDDGIGRQAAEQLKQNKNKYKPPSLGTTITSDRLKIINDIYKTEAKIEIEDLIDMKTQQAKGTRITLQLPELI